MYSACLQAKHIIYWSYTQVNKEGSTQGGIHIYLETTYSHIYEASKFLQCSDN